MSEKRKVLCPHCEGSLNPSNKIILGAKKSETNQSGLVLLSPTPGHYHAITDDSFPLTSGEKLELFCTIPGCQKSLQSTKHPSLCHLIIPKNNRKRIIYFAPDKGQEATFIEDENGKIIKRYGKDQEHYLSDFFDEDLNAQRFKG